MTRAEYNARRATERAERSLANRLAWATRDAEFAAKRIEEITKTAIKKSTAQGVGTRAVQRRRTLDANSKR